MLALVFHIFALLPATSSCINNYGKVACGFHCVAAHGDLACARTAVGACTFTDREIVCWDPPDSVRAHYGDRTPRAECMTSGGNIACGYNCQSRDGGEVRCSSTPDGICVATSRGVTCWDPPIYAYCADDRSLPRPGCVTIDGHAACGYGCATRNGELACASTPGGKCTLSPNQIVCTDPEAPAMCGAVPCRPDDPDTGRWWCRTRRSDAR